MIAMFNFHIIHQFRLPTAFLISLKNTKKENAKVANLRSAKVLDGNSITNLAHFLFLAFFALFNFS